jgi:hypothetical protein
MRRVGTAWYLMQHGMVFRHWVPLPRPRRLHGAVRPPARPPSDRRYAPTAPRERLRRDRHRLLEVVRLHARTRCWRVCCRPTARAAGLSFQASGNAVSFRPVDRSGLGGRRHTAGSHSASSTARVAAARPPARPRARPRAQAAVHVVRERVRCITAVRHPRAQVACGAGWPRKTAPTDAPR